VSARCASSGDSNTRCRPTFSTLPRWLDPVEGQVLVTEWVGGAPPLPRATRSGSARNRGRGRPRRAPVDRAVYWSTRPPSP
jgi:hypothetical protein